MPAFKSKSGYIDRKLSAFSASKFLSAFLKESLLISATPLCKLKYYSVRKRF